MNLSFRPAFPPFSPPRSDLREPGDEGCRLRPFPYRATAEIFSSKLERSCSPNPMHQEGPETTRPQGSLRTTPAVPVRVPPGEPLAYVGGIRRWTGTGAGSWSTVPLGPFHGSSDAC